MKMNKERMIKGLEIGGLVVFLIAGIIKVIVSEVKVHQEIKQYEMEYGVEIENIKHLEEVKEEKAKQERAEKVKRAEEMEEEIEYEYVEEEVVEEEEEEPFYYIEDEDIRNDYYNYSNFSQQFNQLNAIHEKLESLDRYRKSDQRHIGFCGNGEEGKESYIKLRKSDLMKELENMEINSYVLGEYKEELKSECCEYSAIIILDNANLLRDRIINNM